MKIIAGILLSNWQYLQFELIYGKTRKIKTLRSDPN